MVIINEELIKGPAFFYKIGTITDDRKLENKNTVLFMPGRLDLVIHFTQKLIASIIPSKYSVVMSLLVVYFDILFIIF